MSRHKIAWVAGSAPDTKLVEEQLAGLDYQLDVHLCGSEGETIEAIKGADVIINGGMKMPRQVVEAIDTAQAIVSFGHGFDRIDHDAAAEHGVMVVNTAGFCTEEVSNHAIMLLLACAKHLANLNSTVKEGRWDAAARAAIGPLAPIDGQTLGLVGLGNIARATARKAMAFGLEVIAYDPYVQPWVAKECRVKLAPDLLELARRSDFVSAHVPLNTETRKLLGAAFFRAMKPTAYFINTCRGGTVDERALIRALQQGQIAGAGLDVFEEEPTPAENPLLKMDNVVVTPHSAGTSTASLANAQVSAGQETARVLRGTWPMSLVNPSVRERIPGRAPPTNA